MSVGAHDDGHPLARLIGIAALGFGDEICVRNAAGLQIVPSYLAFTESKIVACPAGSDDHGSQSAFEKGVSVIESCADRQARGVPRTPPLQRQR